jgi:hypothetical protein
MRAYRIVVIFISVIALLLSCLLLLLTSSKWGVYPAIVKGEEFQIGKSCEKILLISEKSYETEDYDMISREVQEIQGILNSRKNRIVYGNSRHLIESITTLLMLNTIIYFFWFRARQRNLKSGNVVPK